MKEQLEQIREWAIHRLDAGQEPPWAWYQYMKLVEAAESILKSMDATANTATMEDLQQQIARQGSGPRLVDEAFLRDTAQRYPEDVEVQMPM